MLEALKIRDGKLIDNWYVACLSRELEEKPLRRVIYDEAFVLFRGNNKQAVCLPDRCLHRTAKLSEGECHEGSLRCPYHGWTYDERGNVVEIPSEGKKVCDGAGPLKPNLTLRPLPCLEIDGCIWVWTGSGKPQSTPWRFPHFEDRAWTKYFMITDFENEVTNLCENFMDVPHTVFVHRGWFRTQEKKRVPMNIDVKDGQVLVTYDQPKDSIGFTSRLVNPSGEPMVHTDRFIFPNVTRVDYNFGSKSSFIINSQCTPVSTMNSRVYTYICYRIGSWGQLIKPFFQFYTRQVIQQDVDIMKNQGDNLKAHPDAKFNSTDADEVHIAIERLRAMGIRGESELWELAHRREKEFWI